MSTQVVRGEPANPSSCPRLLRPQVPEHCPTLSLCPSARSELRESGQESFQGTPQNTTQEVSREEKTRDNGETQQTKEVTVGLANHYWTSKASRQQQGKAESKELLQLLQKPTHCLDRAGTTLPGTAYSQEVMSWLKTHLQA